MLAIRPCRPKVVWLFEPSGFAVSTSYGAPLCSRPHRASSSSNPSSHPSPPCAAKFTNAGFTGPSAIGESQPSRFPSYHPFHSPMPRVGTTENRSAPLSTTIMSTPSRLPPLSVCFFTENGWISPSPSAGASISSDSTHVSVPESVSKNVGII